MMRMASLSVGGISGGYGFLRVTKINDGFTPVFDQII